MSAAAEVPLWVAVLTSALVLAGSAITLLGSVGLLRLGSFYGRVHAPTLGATLGMTCILVGSSLFFSVQEGRLVIREILIAVFVTLTTPVALMLLVRAAVYRDRMEGNPEVPPADAPDDPPHTADRPSR